MAACLHVSRTSITASIRPLVLQRPRLEVVRSGIEPVVPKPGDVVTARVIRINPRLAAGVLLGWGHQGRH